MKARWTCGPGCKNSGAVCRYPVVPEWRHTGPRAEAHPASGSGTPDDLCVLSLRTRAIVCHAGRSSSLLFDTLEKVKVIVRGPSRAIYQIASSCDSRQQEWS